MSTNLTFDQTYEGNNHDQTKSTVKHTKRNCSFQNEWPRRTWLRWGACCTDGLSLVRCRLELALSGGPLAPPMKMSALKLRTQNPTNIECHHYYSAAQCCTSWVWANTSLLLPRGNLYQFGVHVRKLPAGLLDVQNRRTLLANNATHFSIWDINHCQHLLLWHLFHCQTFWQEWKPTRNVSKLCTRQINHSVADPFQFSHVREKQQRI